MFYKEAGQFKTSYGADQAVFPIIQDRWFIAVVLIVAYAVVLHFGHISPSESDFQPFSRAFS